MNQNFTSASSSRLEALRQSGDDSSLDQCPDIDFIRKQVAYSQSLKEAMDRHSASACGIAWVMLVFSLFGILSNSVSLGVFSHHSMRRVPVNVLLAGLSCIDLFLSIFVLPVFVAPALNLYYRWDIIDRTLPYITFVLYPLTLMTQTASVWVFVVITCERWAAVVRPLQARRYSSVSNAKKAFAGVCVAAILYNLIRFGEFRLVTRRYPDKIVSPLPDCAMALLFPTADPALDSAGPEGNLNSGSPVPSPTPTSPVTRRSGKFKFSTPVSKIVTGKKRNLGVALTTATPSTTTVPIMEDPYAAPELEPRLRYDATYMFFYYFGLYLLTHFIVPFSILLIVNIHVVWTILRTRALRRHLTTHERREHRITLMMGVVVVAFLLCNTIPFAMNLLEAYDRDYFRRVETLYITHLVNDIGNLLVVVNSSTTSLIYYAFSQRYRRHCASRLCFKTGKRKSMRLHGKNLSFRESLHAETMFDPMTEVPTTAPHSREVSPRRYFYNSIFQRTLSRRYRRGEYA